MTAILELERYLALKTPTTICHGSHLSYILRAYYHGAQQVIPANAKTLNPYSGIRRDGGLGQPTDRLEIYTSIEM